MDASARQLSAVCQRRACRQSLQIHILAAEDAAETFLSVTRKHDALIGARSRACIRLIPYGTLPVTRGRSSCAAAGEQHGARQPEKS